MATSSLLGIDTDNLPPAHSATGIDSLGPSDASDSGSDSAGAYSAESDSDTDRFGTGERGSVEPDQQTAARDILPDHVESMGMGEAGRDAGSPDDDSQDGERNATSRGRGGLQAGASPLTPDDLPEGDDNDIDADDETEGDAEGKQAS